MPLSPDTQLEEMLKLLVERFGADRSLGEVFATCHALRTAREGRDFSVSPTRSGRFVTSNGLPRFSVVIWTRHANARRRPRLTRNPLGGWQRGVVPCSLLP